MWLTNLRCPAVYLFSFIELWCEVMGKMHTLGLLNGLGEILETVQFPKNHACTLSEERPDCTNASPLNRPQLMHCPLQDHWRQAVSRWSWLTHSQQTRSGPSVYAVISNPFQEFTNVMSLPRDSKMQGPIYKTRIHYKRLISKTSVLALESSDPQTSGSGGPFLGDINSACFLT